MLIFTQSLWLCYSTDLQLVADPSRARAQGGATRGKTNHTARTLLEIEITFIFSHFGEDVWASVGVVRVCLGMHVCVRRVLPSDVDYMNTCNYSPWTEPWSMWWVLHWGPLACLFLCLLQCNISTSWHCCSKDASPRSHPKGARGTELQDLSLQEWVSGFSSHLVSS